MNKIAEKPPVKLKTIVYCLVFLMILFSWIKNKIHPPIKKADTQQIHATAPKPIDCGLDAKCIGKHKLSLETITECVTSIEAKAKYRFSWTDDWQNPKFIVYQWKTANKSVLTMAGGQLEVQNGFNAWQKMSYQCNVLLETGHIIDVKIKPLHH